MPVVTDRRRGQADATARSAASAERAIEHRSSGASRLSLRCAAARRSALHRPETSPVIEVRKDVHVFLMRITLPDRPGSLGSVATAMGSVGADINAVEIVEKKSDGSVVDDFIVDLPPNQLPETIVTACQKPRWRTRGVDCALSRGRRAAVRPGGAGADDG